MSEQQIQDGFDRLQGALAPPVDAAERVQRRVRARRRHRRTALVGAGALVVAGAAGGAVVLGSGDDGTDRVVASDPGTQQGGSFTLTRADGSTIVVDDLTVSCDQAPGPIGEPAEPGHLYLSSPFLLDESEERLEQPFLYLDLDTRRTDGRDLTLPVESRSGSSEDRALLLFAADADGSGDGPDRANEVSSAEPGAGGTVRVLRASCDPVPVLELEVDAALGSEVQQGAWRIEGRFRQG